MTHRQKSTWRDRCEPMRDSTSGQRRLLGSRRSAGVTSEPEEKLNLPVCEQMPACVAPSASRASGVGRRSVGARSIGSRFVSESAQVVACSKHSAYGRQCATPGALVTLAANQADITAIAAAARAGGQQQRNRLRQGRLNIVWLANPDSNPRSEVIMALETGRCQALTYADARIPRGRGGKQSCHPPAGGDIRPRRRWARPMREDATCLRVHEYAAGGGRGKMAVRYSNSKTVHTP